MITSYLERYLRDICRRLSIPTRDQDILIDRISKHRTYHWLSLKYGISLTRLNQIVRRFWHRLWVGTMAFGKFCKEENELIKELKRIRLYNPDRLYEFIDTHESCPIAEYSFSARIEKCLQSAGITTVDQLIRKTESDLFPNRNLGKTCIKKIRDILSYYGYSLKSEVIWSIWVQISFLRQCKKRMASIQVPVVPSVRPIHV